MRFLSPAGAVGLSAITACAGWITRTPIKDLSRRIEFESFSMLPPQGEKWSVVSPAGPYNMLMEKDLGVIHENPMPTVIANIYFTTIDEVPAEQRQDLLEEVTRRLKQDASGGRFDLIEFESVSDVSFGADCRRYSVSCRDRGNPDCPGCTYILKSRGIVCLHPHRALMIKAEYGPRVPEGTAITSVEAEGDAFLNSIVFK
jgi:hypothetical protein